MMLLAYVPGTIAWRRRRDLRLCHRTAARIQEIVDGEIPVGRAQRDFERHLAACERCGAEAEVFRSLKLAIARVNNRANADLVRKLERLARQLCDNGDSLDRSTP